LTGGPPVRDTPLAVGLGRESSLDPTLIGDWCLVANQVARAIHESTGLSVEIDCSAESVRVSLGSASLASQFAAALNAENTGPACSQNGDVWLEVGASYTIEEITLVVLGVNKVAYHLGQCE